MNDARSRRVTFSGPLYSASKIEFPGTPWAIPRPACRARFPARTGHGNRSQRRDLARRIDRWPLSRVERTSGRPDSLTGACPPPPNRIPQTRSARSSLSVLGGAPCARPTDSAGFGTLLDRAEVGLHARSELAQPPGDDALLLVRHQLDDLGQVGRPRSQPGPLAQLGAVAARGELEPPQRRRPVRVLAPPRRTPAAGRTPPRARRWSTPRPAGGSCARGTGRRAPARCNRAATAPPAAPGSMSRSGRCR